jgi:hypothetical protein
VQNRRPYVTASDFFGIAVVMTSAVSDAQAAFAHGTRGTENFIVLERPMPAIAKFHNATSLQVSAGSRTAETLRRAQSTALRQEA